jgi:hypothetical protein
MGFISLLLVSDQRFFLSRLETGTRKGPMTEQGFCECEIVGLLEWWTRGLLRFFSNSVDEVLISRSGRDTLHNPAGVFHYFVYLEGKT